MRTFTVVPSFEGESAYFELPDIGFQNDHLSFAILFNLTELTEHWPNISPSMIVTDPKANTFIAPYTNWNAETHIFTWRISSTETAYEGTLKCQLKCTSLDDPETIICMSQICQTRVYQSLEAASDPPEAFQSWIDTLTQLGSQVSEDLEEARTCVEVSETNARAAQESAEEAEEAKAVAISSKEQAEESADLAVSAKDSAILAKQKSENAEGNATSAMNAAIEANNSSQAALEEVDAVAARTAQMKSDVETLAERVATNSTDAAEAKRAAEAARDASIGAKDQAVVAKTASEVAREGSEEAEAKAEAAQSFAENAEDQAKRWAIGVTKDGNPVDASDQTYKNNAKYWNNETKSINDQAKRWAIGMTADGQQVPSTDQTYNNNAKYWADNAEDSKNEAETSEDNSRRWAVGITKDGDPVTSSDQTYKNNAKYWSDKAKSAKDAVMSATVSTVFFDSYDSSVTVVIGGGAIVNKF